MDLGFLLLSWICCCFVLDRKRELETLIVINDCKGSVEEEEDSIRGFIKVLEDRGVSMESQVPVSVDSANSLMSKLRFLVEPFKVVTDEMCPWEEKSAVIRLSNKMRKSKRNKLWRKRKRRRVAETLAKVCCFQSLVFLISAYLSHFHDLRNGKGSNKLIKKLMNGEPGKLPRISRNARYINYNTHLSGFLRFPSADKKLNLMKYSFAKMNKP